MQAINNGAPIKGRDHVFFQPKSLVNCQFPTEKPNHEDIWVKCASCQDLVYIKHYIANSRVCAKCGKHGRLRWDERLKVFLDEGSWVEVNAELKTGDPLQFVNKNEAYTAKVAQTRKKSNLNESLVTGYGTVEGRTLGVAVTDFSFLGASMGSVFGEKLVRLINLCIQLQMPLLTVNASGGARMHEGIFSLMQMAKTTAALGRLGKARLPHISLLTDPCYGGVTASYALVADLILAEPGAMIGFAGPRVIEQTTRQKLPENFQTAEFLQQHGLIDQVVPRSELRQKLANTITLYDRIKKPVATPATGPALLTFPLQRRYSSTHEESWQQAS